MTVQYPAATHAKQLEFEHSLSNLFVWLSQQQCYKKGSLTFFVLQNVRMFFVNDHTPMTFSQGWITETKKEG